MQLYLVINPEYDYEILAEGDINENFESHFVIADNSDEAILKYAENYGDSIEDLQIQSLTGYLAIAVQETKFKSLSAKAVGDLKKKIEQVEAEQELEEDLKELERLQKKLKAQKKAAKLI